MLLEKLCNAFGTSGNEHEVINIIKDEITPYADNIKIDSIGNLVVFKKGIDSSKKVMISCHTDEVGFIISDITKEGYLQFKVVGGIDTRVIISKKVIVGDKRIKGIIGLKAIHLTTKSERESVPKISDLFIDIGAKDKEDAQKFVKIGDYATFDTKFAYLSQSSIKAKAIDDRAGCYILCELLKNIKSYKYDTYFCFTSQEEVGLRGSRVCAYDINPDIALVVESTTCADVNDVKEHQTVTKMNNGVCISFMDRTTIVNKDYCDKLMSYACEYNIPAQYKQMVAGGNDAGAIHLTRCGIPTATLSVPCRYLHSPCSVASINDINATYELAKVFLENVEKF